MTLDSLYGRIAVAFAAVLIAFGLLQGALSYAAAKRDQHQVMQQISRGLAAHIADQGRLIGPNGIDRKAVDDLFHMTTAVNPSIDIYLLDGNGWILAHSPRDSPLARDRVSLAPLRAFVAGERLPVQGDSPRDAERQEAFSAAPIVIDGRVAGYLYVVLVGGMYREIADGARDDYALRTAAWTGATALGLALLVGLAAFARITRPLNALTRAVQRFEHGDFAGEPCTHSGPATSNDEIGRLASAFDAMARRLSTQMAELKRQDDLRRELVANISHDLRTPLTSMQNYLETLVRLGDGLSPAEQRQYLAVAMRHSQRVAKLSQQLFELARLECEEALPQAETFSLSELLQDIAQKFELAAQDKGVRLTAKADPAGLYVRGDIGMIERVITNLLDNAIRHTPEGGEIRLEAAYTDRGVEVEVADSGVGIAAAFLPGLFERDSPLRQRSTRGNGGLGLLIADRIVALHGARMCVASEPGHGTTFTFALPAARIGVTSRGGVDATNTVSANFARNSVDTSSRGM